VTGVTLGRRSLKFIDNGIMAATFVNLDSGRAFRIVARESARDLAAKYAPEEENPLKRQLAAYQIMPPEVLFQIEEVRVAVPECDLPGPTKFKAVCEDCQMVVRDKKEIRRNGRILCRACALGTYYDTLT
jgi:formylmethanofuran dehydrogenase subunit E